MFLEFILDRPLYLLFVLANIWIIYKFIKNALSDGSDDDSEDDDDDGGITLTDPDLDLPPGVTLPKDEFEPVA